MRAGVVLMLHHLVVWTLLVVVRRHRMFEYFVETVVWWRLLISLARLMYPIN